MANKYHISPETGRPNICRATTKDCPVGGAHYDSKDEARAGYESSMKEETFSKPKKKLRAVEAAEALNAKAIAEAAKEAEALGDDWEEEYFDEEEDAPEESIDFSELSEEISIDDDFSDIKCDDCGRPLNQCVCGECEYCGVEEGDEHEEDCPRYKPVRKAYSWD